jgi:hypothetical protein
MTPDFIFGALYGATVAVEIWLILRALHRPKQRAKPTEPRTPAPHQDVRDMLRNRFPPGARHLSDTEATQGMWDQPLTEAERIRAGLPSAEPALEGATNDERIAWDKRINESEPPSIQPDATDTAEAKAEREALTRYERIRRANRKEVRNDATSDK